MIELQPFEQHRSRDYSFCRRSPCMAQTLACLLIRAAPMQRASEIEQLLQHK